jgi:hypothetical protein
VNSTGSLSPSWRTPTGMASPARQPRGPKPSTT